MKNKDIEKAIVLLKNFIEYEEIKKIFNSLFCTNTNEKVYSPLTHKYTNKKDNKELEAKTAAIASLGTLTYYYIKAVYFSLLVGKAHYYGFKWSDVYVNADFVYEIALCSFIVLILGFITIIFLAIWFSKCSIFFKLVKTALLCISEKGVVLLLVILDLHGLKISSAINEVKTYGVKEWIVLVAVLGVLALELNYYGIVIAIMNRNNEKKNSEVKSCKKGNPSNKNGKSRILILVGIGIVFLFLSAIWGSLNELTTTTYKTIEEIVDGQKVSEKYVIILENQDYYICNKITKEGAIDTNLQVYFKRDNMKVKKIFNQHMDKISAQ